jgi:hypothetical protein
MYFNEKEDTNIDKEFGKKNNFDFDKWKKPLIIVGIIALLLIIIMIISALRRNSKEYFITLEGDEEMTLYKDSEYIEPGYLGFDNARNTYDVAVEGEVDTKKVGTYILTYKLKNVEKKRTINVVEEPEHKTVIHLDGDINMTINAGSTYTEPGYSAIDTFDGTITDKVKVKGSVDTSKKGVYKIVYSVINSAGITYSVTRTVVVE